MAPKIDRDDLKQQALLKLAAGREELTAQAAQLRTELNPRLAARRLFEQHTGAVVLATFAAGLVVTALVLRGRRRAPSERSMRKDWHAAVHAQAPGASFLGTLFRALTPALVKIAITRPLDQFFAHQQRQEEKVPE